MPEHLKAMVVILCLASVVFAVTRKPFTAIAMATEDFKRRRNLWIALTLIAFLTQNIWIYMVATALVLLATNRYERNPVALFFFLLFAIPPAQADIPGFGVINYFFGINHLRLLELVILLPVLLRLGRQSGTEPLGAVTTDKYVGGYLALMFGLELTATTFTDALRHLFYTAIDVALPYYVASRSLRRLEELRDAMSSFVMAALLMVPVALFEFTRHWLLYEALVNAQGLSWGGIQSYLWRGDSLRALASTGQPIALGYVMSVATILYLFLRPSIKDRFSRNAGLMALVAGLIAPLSRGPWVGMVAMVLTLVLTGPVPFQRFAIGAALGLLAFPVLLVSPFGNTVIDHLPFVGQLDAGNVQYREHLFYVAMDVIAEHPWLGNTDYLLDPRMQALKQGQGIVDVVNSYLEIALHSGLVGLILFLSVFASLMFLLHSNLRRLADRSSDEYRLGQTLLAALVGILVTIATASGVTVVPIVYWSLIGLGVAYVRLMSREGNASSVKGWVSTGPSSIPNKRGAENAA